MGRIEYIDSLIPYGSRIFKDNENYRAMFYSDSLVSDDKYDELCNCIYGYLENVDTLLVVLLNHSNSAFGRFDKKFMNEDKKIYIMLLHDYFATIAFNIPIGELSKKHILPSYIKNVDIMDNKVFIFLENDRDVKDIRLRKKAKEKVYSKLKRYPHFDKVIDFDTRVVFDSMENLNKNYDGNGFYYYR